MYMYEVYLMTGTEYTVLTEVRCHNYHAILILMYQGQLVGHMGRQMITMVLNRHKYNGQVTCRAHVQHTCTLLQI